MAQNYWIQVKNKDWHQMLDLITQKDIYIRKVIAFSNKEKQILKAEQALLELTKILYNNLVSRVPHAKSA
jgi:hypothetical protein